MPVFVSTSGCHQLSALWAAFLEHFRVLRELSSCQTIRAEYRRPPQTEIWFGLNPGLDALQVYVFSFLGVAKLGIEKPVESQGNVNQSDKGGQDRHDQRAARHEQGAWVVRNKEHSQPHGELWQTSRQTSGGDQTSAVWI